MTTDEAVQWVKDNPDRVLHRSTGEGPCKEAELEELLKEAKALFECDSGEVGTCLKMGRLETSWCPRCRFLARPDVKRFLDG